MKKYLLGIFAVVLAIGFSAFTASEAPKANEKQTIVYLIYGSGEQQSISNYTQTTVAPACAGTGNLCAIRFSDANGVVTPAEFNPVFNALDTNDDLSLDDETETATLLQKP